MQTQTQEERYPSRQQGRVHPRYEVSLAITLIGDNNFYVGLSQNISEGGVFIATHRVLPIGTPVVLLFTLPDSDEPLYVTGIVQWLRAADPEVEGASDEWIPFVKSGMGIRFEELDEKAVSCIRAFTDRRSPEFFD